LFANVFKKMLGSVSLFSIVDREPDPLYNSKPKSVKYKLFLTLVGWARLGMLMVFELGESFHILITSSFL
jgi:hypothetical protein